MDLATKNFFLYDLFIYGFPLKSKIAEREHEFNSKKIYAEDTCLMRPAGKGLIVSSINFSCRQPFRHATKGKAEYSYADCFCRISENNMGGGGGYT
jgi:hypothetical protein